MINYYNSNKSYIKAVEEKWLKGFNEVDSQLKAQSQISNRISDSG